MQVTHSGSDHTGAKIPSSFEYSVYHRQCRGSDSQPQKNGMVISLFWDCFLLNVSGHIYLHFILVENTCRHRVKLLIESLLIVGWLRQSDNDSDTFSSLAHHLLDNFLASPTPKTSHRRVILGCGYICYPEYKLSERGLLYLQKAVFCYFAKVRQEYWGQYAMSKPLMNTVDVNRIGSPSKMQPLRMSNWTSSSV